MRQQPFARSGLPHIASLYLALAGLLFPTGYVLADGFRIPEQGAAALGQSNAFAAQADDSSALQYNPAGMARLDRFQYSLGTNFVGGQFSHTNTAGTKTKGDFDGTIANPPPSNLYLTGRLNDFGFDALGDFSIGFGLTAPYGTLTRYPRDAPFATVAIFSALPLVDIKPTIAFNLNETLSVGGGLDIYTFASYLGEGHAELQAVAGPDLAPLGITPGSLLEINGTDTEVGFHLGLLWTPWLGADGKPRLNAAFVYRSQPTLNLKGNFLVDGVHVTNAKTDLELPRIFTWGLALWPVRDRQREWKVEVNLDYADWSAFKNLDIRLSNGVTLPQARNWNSVYVVNVGTEYKWLSLSGLPGWETALRGGYVYSETSVPESTFEPAIPDADYDGISVGIGFLCKKGGNFLGLFRCHSGHDGRFARTSIGVDMAYQVLMYRERNIKNNNAPVVNGKWDTTIHIGGINLRINF